MTIQFTEQEKSRLKVTIFQQEIDSNNLNHSELPTDLHLIEYEMNGKLYCDGVRAYKKVDIFDVYFDKLSQYGGKVISITSGYGNIKPKLFQG